jgi:anti-sigma factor RsiW
MWHPEADLVAFIRGELVGSAHERVARHLEACPDCRRVRDDLRDALAALRGSAPEPPVVHWPSYRAALRGKLEARTVRRGWWRWPVPLALSAGLASVLVFLALQGGDRLAGRPGAGAVETAIAPRLELLRNYRVMERLDLLEDFDILRGLESPTGRREG